MWFRPVGQSSVARSLALEFKSSNLWLISFISKFVGKFFFGFLTPFYDKKEKPAVQEKDCQGENATALFRVYVRVIILVRTNVSPLFIQI